MPARGQEEAGVPSEITGRHRRGPAALAVAVGVGGATGAVARYLVSLAVPAAPGAFPWGTFVINISGSAVLGFLLVLLGEQFPRGRLARPLLGTGVIGAYTTFSTLEVEAVLLARGGHFGLAALDVVGSLAAGLVAVWLGMVLARLVGRAERWLQRQLA